VGEFVAEVSFIVLCLIFPLQLFVILIAFSRLIFSLKRRILKIFISGTLLYRPPAASA